MPTLARTTHTHVTVPACTIPVTGAGYVNF